MACFDLNREYVKTQNAGIADQHLFIYFLNNIDPRRDKPYIVRGRFLHLEKKEEKRNKFHESIRVLED